MEEAENIVASLLKLTYSDVLDESNYNEISPVKWKIQVKQDFSLLWVEKME